MPKRMYLWRTMTPEERQQTLEKRKTLSRPWHSPPHRLEPGQYLLTAACFEHESHIAYSAERFDHFSTSLLDILAPHADRIFAWCVLPNHYHVLLHTTSLKHLLPSIATLHGRMSYNWNTEESARGRQVWCRCTDRAMRSHAHLMATINYVHHNPVKHGYVERWQDWPWSSAQKYLEGLGIEEARRNWLAYPIKDYGKGWDD